MVEKKCQNSLGSDDLDRLLQELALAAKQHPAKSPQRQVTLNRLWQMILQSQHLGRPQKGAWQSNLYEDFYNEALARTGLEICQKIDRYNPEHPVMAWVNFCLNIHFKRAVEDYYKYSSLPSIDDLESDIPGEETHSEDRSLRQFLEEDPEGLLKAESLQKRADVTFQLLALEKYVKDRTWESIANELGIPFSTLSAFFDRRFRKLKPYFLKYLAE
jgi:hypothetical protein